MTTLEKVQFIQDNSGLLSQVPDDYLLYFNQLKEGTDDFRDLAPDVVEIVKDGADKLYTKMAELSKPKAKPKAKAQTNGEKLKEMMKNNPRIIMATVPKNDKPKPKPKRQTNGEKLREMLKNNPRMVMPKSSKNDKTKAKAKRQTVGEKYGEKVRIMLKNNPRMVVMPKAPKIDDSKPRFKEGDYVMLNRKSEKQPQYNDVTSKVISVLSRRDIFSMVLSSPNPKKRQKKHAFIQDDLILSTEAAYKKDVLSFSPTPKARSGKPQPEAKFKVGDKLMHKGTPSYKVDITKVSWIESRKTYVYSYKTYGGLGSDDEKNFMAISAKRKSTAGTTATSNTKSENKYKEMIGKIQGIFNIPIELTKAQTKKYEANEDINYHGENAVLLAQITKNQVLIDSAKFSLKQWEKDGELLPENSDFRRLILSKIKAKYFVEPTKAEPPKFTGTMVRRETEEHRVVRRFLGNRKHPEMNLIVSAYKELVKSILEGKLRKEGAKNPELLYAIQKSYLNVIERKANSLDLAANLLDDAHKVFDSERRYDTVKYLSEYTGWTGKEKTEAQVKLFITKVGNAMKTTKETDPYFDELKQVYDRLKTSKVGNIIMPTQVGLSGIPKGFRIVK